MRFDRWCGGHPDPKVDTGIAVCPVDRGTGGFSLIELLWVIMITSVLVSMAWPSSQQLDRGRVRRAADLYASAHRLARSTGIQNGVMGELHVDTAANRYWIEVDTTSLGVGVTDTIGVVRDMSELDGVDVSGAPTLICFDGRGLPDLRENSQGDTCEPHDGTVIFSLRGEVATLEVTILGKVIR
jgi:prepilin-type N-terminal cleavage/methylation domain-containing protein